MAVREIEPHGTAVLNRDDDLPDLDQVVRGADAPRKAPKTKPVASAVPKPKTMPAADAKESRFANPPGFVLAEGQKAFRVSVQWMGVEGVYDVAAKTEAEAIEVLVGHFRQRCKVV